MTRLTKEERIASKLSDLVNDITLDLSMIGFYIGRYESVVSHDRLTQVIHNAELERQLNEY